MENNSHLVLSDYQRAILNEMGISSWQLANAQQTPEKVENQIHGSVAPSSKVTSKVISKEDALAKLKQLKVQTQTSVTTDSVLVALSPSDVNFEIFTDVLIALGLETKQQKYISSDQLSHFSGFPLSWTQGEKVSLNHKQLITPSLVDLHYPDIKKLLWQQIHNASSLVKN
jgi:DNA polymerase III psi subunit